MKKLKYVILSFLVSSSVSAQEPDLPDLSLPDLSSSVEVKGANSDKNAPGIPALPKQATTAAVPSETAPAATPTPQSIKIQVAPADPSTQKKEILDHAIDEVFKEPNAKTTVPQQPAAVPAVPAAAATVPAVPSTPSVPATISAPPAIATAPSVVPATQPKMAEPAAPVIKDDAEKFSVDSVDAKDKDIEAVKASGSSEKPVKKI